MQLLAVLRAREMNTEAFRAVYRQASSNLAPLAATNLVRWQELLHGLLSYVLRQRPPAERETLVEVLRETNRPRETEVTGMAQTIAEHLMEQGELRTARRLLRRLLEQKFGPLPEAVFQRLEACSEVQKLEEAALKIRQWEKLEDVQL